MGVCHTGCCVPGLKRRLFDVSPYRGLSGGRAVSGAWAGGDGVGSVFSFSPPSKTGASISVRLLLMS